MAITIDLKGLSDATKFTTDYNAVTNVITVDGVAKTFADLKATATATTITIPGYGVITKTSATTMTFTADAACPVGDVTFVGGTATKADLTAVDFSSVTSPITSVTDSTGTKKITKITGTTAADSITSALANTTLVGGAGDDTLTAGTGIVTTLTGGDGADKFVQTNAAATTTITDYNYAQGDKVVLAAAAFGTAAMSSTGTFTDDATTASVTGTAAIGTDGIYKIKAVSGANTQEYWTSKVTTDAVTLDGSAVANVMVIDATGAAKSVVTGGSKNDVISVAGSQVTLNAGSNAGSDSVNGFDGGFSGDVLNLTGTALKNVIWGDNSGAGKYTKIGASELQGLGVNAATGKILVQENGGTAKKVAFTGATTQIISATDADVYMGFADGTTKLDVSGATADTVVNLLDTDKYKNIASITGAANFAGTYIGAVNTAADATGATGTGINLVGANKASQVWGGSKASDTITLNGGNAVQDVVWYGINDGLDKVTNFSTGFKATNDVLNLYNVADVSTLTFGTGKITVGSAADVLDTGLAGAGQQFLLKNSAGVTKKVAVVAKDATDADVVQVNGVGADLVIGHKTATTKVAQDTVVYDATQTANLTVNLLDTSAYKNIANVDLSNVVNSSNIVIGAKDIASAITLGGIATTTNDVWGGSSQANVITAGAGSDTIWFGNNDGKDSVTNFGVAGTDKIKFYDKSVADLTKAYTYDAVNKKFVSTQGVDELTLTGFAGTSVNVLDKNNTAAKVVVGTNLNYDSAAKVYMGTSVAVTGSNDAVLYLGNGVDATVNDIYFSGVTQLNAAASAGKNVLIGSSTGNDVLTAGSTSTAMWGGGKAADTMTGNDAGVDQFWFGSGDGNDTVYKADKKDTIVLYNTTSINDITMTISDDLKSLKISAKDGSSLLIDDSTGTIPAGATTALTGALDGGLTFQFGTNADAKSYTYNRISKSFVAK